MASPRSCVSKVEKRCSSIVKSPESTSLLYTKNTHKGYTGRLASLTSPRWAWVWYDLNNRHGQHHCSTWAEQSCTSSRPRGPCGLAIGKSLGCDAGPIPTVDTSVPLRAKTKSVDSHSHSRFVPGWICPTSAIQYFELSSIPFPGLPNLLLSATHLVVLRLSDIPHSGYISPKAMVAVLSALSSLESLYLQFRSPQSRPDFESRSLLPPKRSILTALNGFYFKGVTEYLEELVIRIDAPQLVYMEISFFNQIDFDCPRLAQFINRTPSLMALDEADVQFDDFSARVRLRSRTSESTFDADDLSIDIGVICIETDWQLSSIEQVCNSSLPPCSTVEVLYIDHDYRRLVWKNDAIENTLWLQLLLPFTAVKNLYLSKQFAPGIAVALQDVVAGRITVVMPSLQNIFVEALEPSGPFQENIAQFVTARQLSGHPVAISTWNK